MLLLFPDCAIAAKVNQDDILQKTNVLKLTIRKRVEVAATIPAAISSFSADEVAQRGLNSPTNVAQATPGFSYTDPFGRFNPAPTLRGMLQPGLGEEPPVATFVDGAYLSGRSSVNTLVFDAERVDIIKGPQSALYGRNSFAGTMAITSAAPKFEDTYSFDSRFSSPERNELTAVVNQKLSDEWAMRAAYYRRDWGGFFENSVSGPEIGEEKTHAGRLSVKYQPNNNREFVWRFTGVGDADGQPKGFLVRANCGRRTTNGALRYFCGEVPEEAATYAANSAHNGFQRQHFQSQLAWTEGWSADWSSHLLISGSDERSEFNRDDDYQAALAARAGQATRRYDMQLDGRVNYDPEQSPWHGLMGVSLYRFRNDTQRYDQFYILGATTPSGAQNETLHESLGIYGSVGVAFAKGWDATFDGRWQTETKNLKSTIVNNAGRRLDLEDDWQSFSPKLTLSYTDARDVVYYISGAKGDKSGGFNDRANIRDSERAYGPEYNLTFEAGMKNYPLPYDIKVGANVFWIEWLDQQVTAYSTLAATQNFYLNNAGRSRSLGGELSIDWVPDDRYGASLAYSYTRARFVSYNDPDLANIAGYTPLGKVDGNDLPRYSPHQFAVAGFYGQPLPGTPWHWQMAAQGYYQDAQHTDNSNQAHVGDRFQVNSQLNFSDGRYTLGAWVENMLDDRTAQVGIPWVDATAGFGRAWLVVPADGRAGGLRFAVRY